MRVQTYRAVAGLATVFAATTLSAQETPYDLRDMVGARAGQAESTLMERGYVNVNTRPGDDRVWTNWWNASRQACVTIMTRNGRYEAITTTPAPDCRQSGVAGARPPAWGPGQQPAVGARPPAWGPGQPDYGRPDNGRPGYDRPGYGQPGWGGGGAWGQDMTLVCYGGGARPSLGSGWQYEWNTRERRYTPRYGTQLGSSGFTADVQVQLTGGQGWIHLRGKMIPPINSRGSDGWWPLTDLNIGRDVITARYRLNGLNKPRLTIDRRSGRIDISGQTSFSGSCDSGDWGRGRRF